MFAEQDIREDSEFAHDFGDGDFGRPSDGDDCLIFGLPRVADFIKSMGAVPAVQLGHTGRKGGMTRPWDGYYKLPENDADTWEAIERTDTRYSDKRFPRGTLMHKSVPRWLM